MLRQIKARILNPKAYDLFFTQAASLVLKRSQLKPNQRTIKNNQKPVTTSKKETKTKPRTIEKRRRHLKTSRINYL